MYNNELIHYGVPGMKWGHRKRYFYKSDKAYNKMSDYGDKINDRKKNPTNRNAKKMNRLYAKYDKQANKDIRKSLKSGDMKTASKISAGRTYAKLMVDKNFHDMAIAECARSAKVKAGKDFSYKVTRNDKLGGVTITVNKHSQSYIYDPSNNFVKKEKINN